MKKYSYRIRRMREADIRTIRFKDKFDAIISSEEFIEKFRDYVEYIAIFKEFKDLKTGVKRSFIRSTEYAAIGIMDRNDMIQEAYLAFLEAYANIDWNKVDNEADSRGAMVWTYLKKTTLLNFERSIRQHKDGIRIPEYIQTGTITLVTKLFSQLEKVFSNNEADVSITKWETDLAGAFLEVHMDEYLDLTRNGNRDLKKNERDVIKALFGIDQPRKTYKELSDYYDISQSTIRKVKERAIKRLQAEESKEKIADFLHEYRINTKADTEKYRK